MSSGPDTSSADSHPLPDSGFPVVPRWPAGPGFLNFRRRLTMMGQDLPWFIQLSRHFPIFRGDLKVCFCLLSSLGKGAVRLRLPDTGRKRILRDVKRPSGGFPVAAIPPMAWRSTSERAAAPGACIDPRHVCFDFFLNVRYNTRQAGTSRSGSPGCHASFLSQQKKEISGHEGNRTLS